MLSRNDIFTAETDQESDLESVHSLKTIHTEDMETYLNDVIETAEEVREAKALMDMMLDSNGDLKRMCSAIFRMQFSAPPP